MFIVSWLNVSVTRESHEAACALITRLHGLGINATFRTVAV